jgi:hypothetical protein
MTADASVHADLERLAFLLGTWRGEGHGDYPSIDAFDYGEEMVFDHVGDAFLLYSQRSWLLDADRTPLHFERGFLRPASDRVELTLAHPLGLTEVAEGTCVGAEIDLRSTQMGRTSTGDAVTGIARRLRVEGDTLSYTLDMEMEGVPMTFHTAAALRRV